MKEREMAEKPTTLTLAPEKDGAVRTLTIVVVTTRRIPAPIVTFHLSPAATFEEQARAIEGAMDILRSLRERVGSALIASCILGEMDAEKERKH